MVKTKVREGSRQSPAVDYKWILQSRTMYLQTLKPYICFCQWSWRLCNRSRVRVCWQDYRYCKSVSQFHWNLVLWCFQCSNKGQGSFSPVGQDCQWVHRPSPEKVLLVILGLIVWSLLQRHTKRVPSTRFTSAALPSNSNEVAYYNNLSPQIPKH